MTDPTIRERLRELGHKPLPDGRCEHRWRNRLTRAVRCPFLEGFQIAEAELDTLERRVRAAEGDRERFARLIVSYADLTHRVVKEGGDWHEISAEWSLVVSAARSLISGTKEPTDG